jgi:hypothetical protein
VSYTSVANVAGMFPTFVTGTSTQKPSNTLIQQYIDDVAGDLNAILQKRFGEVINSSFAGSFATFQAAFSQDALNILEKINRYGAAAQLGVTLATFGVASAEKLGKDFEDTYEELRSRLEAIDERGHPLPSGMYDLLFDPEARIESPRPGLQGIAGGDMPKHEGAPEEGLDDYFWKSERF